MMPASPAGASPLADGAVRLKDVVFDRAAMTFRFDCTLQAGTITAIAGASGSGKTTLLNILAGFERPKSGQILYGGTDMTEAHPSARPVSLVFQENNLFAHLDLYRNIGLGIDPGLKLDVSDRARIAAALERTGLGGYEARMPGSLSGGERQRAAFARALVRDRPVLLLDEPFAALDPALRTAMGTLLMDLQRETGVTVALVTHNPTDVERLADRVLFLDKGQIIADEERSVFFNRSGPATITDFLGRFAGDARNLG